MYPLPDSTRDLYDEVATLRQEAKEADRKLAISEAACASAMAEVEALTRDNVDAGRRIGESNDQIDHLQRELVKVRNERDELAAAVAHIVAMVDHDTSLPVLLHAVVELRRFVEPGVGR